MALATMLSDMDSVVGMKEIGSLDSQWKKKMLIIWVAEGDNGTVQFDSPPSDRDVREACEDLEGNIEVYQVECIEIKRTLISTVIDEQD